MNLSDLATNFRLHNFIKSSGAAIEDLESFIVNISTSNLPTEKVVELVNLLHDVSKAQSIPLEQVSGYIKQKLEEKEKIDEQIKEVDAVLQSRNVTLEAINEYLKLNEELEKHGLATGDINKLLSVLSIAKKYGFGGKEIAEKLWNIQELEWKEKELKDKCKKLSKRISKYKEIIPFTE